MLDLTKYTQKLTEACDHYERAAPTVHAHCDDLFQRIELTPSLVTLYELVAIQNLWREAEWMHPSYAANAVYKVRYTLNMDTTGHAGF